MNDDQLDDLKQFIAATVSQTETRLDDKIETLKMELDQHRKETADGFKVVREEVAGGFVGVGEAIEEVHHIIDDHAKSTDQRLTRLEQQAV